MSTNDATKEPATQAFQEGLVDQGSQRIVAMAVNVNFELDDGPKRRGHAIPLHAIPLMRRMFPNGVVKALSYWPRGIDRCRTLNQDQLKKELETLTRSYGVKRAGETSTILAEVYGTTEVDQLRNLHAKMKEIALAWKRLEHEAMGRLPIKFPGVTHTELELHGVTSQVITDAEIEALVDIIEPSAKEVEALQLPDLGDLPSFDKNKQGAVAPALGTPAANLSLPPAGDADPVDWLTDELVSVLKLEPQDAIRITSLIIEADTAVPGADPDPKLLEACPALQKADGTLHGTKHEQIKRLARQYRQKASANAPAQV